MSDYGSYEVLVKARELLTKGWCKEFALDKSNNVTGHLGEYVLSNPKTGEYKYIPAVKWSITGAILAAEFLMENEITINNHWHPNFKCAAYKYVDCVAQRIGFPDYNIYADPDKKSGRKVTQEDILDLMDDAIGVALLAKTFMEP